MRGSAELPTIGWLSDPEHWLSIAEPVALFHRIGWLRHPGIFTMYLIHQQVIYFSIILLNGKINPYMNALVNFGVAMIISYVISGILLKFKVTRFLIGQK